MLFGSFYCFSEFSRRFAVLFRCLSRCVLQQKRHPPSERTDAPSFGVAVCFFCFIGRQSDYKSGNQRRGCRRKRHNYKGTFEIRQYNGYRSAHRRSDFASGGLKYGRHGHGRKDGIGYVKKKVLQKGGGYLFLKDRKRDGADEIGHESHNDYINDYAHTFCPSLVCFAPCPPL